MTTEERVLALEYLPKARMLARVMKTAHPYLDRDDILSACHVALCLATQRWEPARGGNFLNCLAWQVKAEISRLHLDARPSGFKHATRYPWHTVPTTVRVAPWLAWELAE